MNSSFFAPSSLDEDTIKSKLKPLYATLEDGELYCEWSESEYFGWDDKCLKNSSFYAGGGFGLRGVVDDTTGFAYAAEFTADALVSAVQTVGAVRHANAGYELALHTAPSLPPKHPGALYTQDSPLLAFSFTHKLEIMRMIDDYLRAADSRVKQASASISGGWKKVWIYRHDGQVVEDTRPLVQIAIRVMVEENGVMESGSASAGGREGYARIIAPEFWQQLADKALKQAITKLDSVPAELKKHWTLPMALAFLACCSMKQSATGWRVILTAKRPQLLPTKWASKWQAKG